jgi:hypothetical protein
MTKSRGMSIWTDVSNARLQCVYGVLKSSGEDVRDPGEIVGASAVDIVD